MPSNPYQPPEDHSTPVGKQIDGFMIGSLACTCAAWSGLFWLFVTTTPHGSWSPLRSVVSMGALLLCVAGCGMGLFAQRGKLLLFLASLSPFIAVAIVAQL